MPVGGGAPIRTWLPECLDHGGEVYMLGNPSEWKSIYKATTFQVPSIYPGSENHPSPTVIVKNWLILDKLS